MASFNKVMLIGNLTADPEIRYTPKGTAVTDLRMAVNRVFTNDAGQRQEEVLYVDVTFFGRSAELAGQYLAKGRSVFIEGRLRMDTWEDKATGQKRSKISVLGESMQFLGSREGGGGDGGHGGPSNYQPRQNQDAPSSPRQQQGAPPAQQSVPEPSQDFDDDDIPF